MRKLTYLVTEGEETYDLVFITDRTPQWTINEYTRHRLNCSMELIGDEPTEETESNTYKL